MSRVSVAFHVRTIPVRVSVGVYASWSVRSPRIVKITHDKCGHIFALHYLKEVREKREWEVEERGGGGGWEKVKEGKEI